MNKNLIFLSTLLSVFILNGSVVHALTTEEKGALREERTKMKEQREDEKNQRETARIEKKTAKCTEITSKIANRKTQIEKAISNYSSSITKIEGLLNTRIQELKTAGKDTSEIEANLNTFKSISSNVATKQQALLSQLQGIDATTCETNKTALSTSMKSFNASVKEINTLKVEVKKYIRDNIVAKIKALKEVSNE
jgi:chromosome segregation ATPase